MARKKIIAGNWKMNMTPASLGVMFIFQFPAIIFFLAISYILLIYFIKYPSAAETAAVFYENLFVISSHNTRKLFALQELKGSSATGGDMSHLIAKSKSVDCCHGI